MDEQQFRRNVDSAMESLKQSLIRAEDSAEIEVEESGGALKVNFEDPPAIFVISPNAPVQGQGHIQHAEIDDVGLAIVHPLPPITRVHHRIARVVEHLPPRSAPL